MPHAPARAYSRGPSIASLSHARFMEDPENRSSGNERYPEDVGIDVIARVKVEAEAGQILKPKVQIAIDRRFAQPLSEIGRASSIAAEQFHRLRKTRSLRAIAARRCTQAAQAVSIRSTSIDGAST